MPPRNPEIPDRTPAESRAPADGPAGDAEAPQSAAKTAREMRLAAALRENLRRRKAAKPGAVKGGKES
jgi:hypothetical protein